jgi:hypothetical protein
MKTVLDWAHEFIRECNLDEVPIENEDGSVIVGRHRLSVPLEREPMCTCVPVRISMVGGRSAGALGHSIDCFLDIVRYELSDLATV